MEIDLKQLDKCPVLTDYEKDLVRRVDANHETQARVAKSFEKTTSTICTQHKKALGKFDKWLQSTEKQDKPSADEDFDRKVFRMFHRGILPDMDIEKLGNVDRVLGLWGNIAAKGR